MVAPRTKITETFFLMEILHAIRVRNFRDHAEPMPQESRATPAPYHQSLAQSDGGISMIAKTYGCYDDQRPS